MIFVLVWLEILSNISRCTVSPPHNTLHALTLGIHWAFWVCLQDQDALLHELHSVRYFDVFEFNAAKKHWACFLCNHPEKAMGLLQHGDPAIEGQLKEKKGRWKLFKRWKTRYFTLSGATMTYSKKDSVSTANFAPPGEVISLF